MYTQIITPSARTATIEVPQEMVGQQVKITIDPVRDTKPVFRTVEEVHAAFNAVRIDTRGWKFNRDEANER